MGLVGVYEQGINLYYVFVLVGWYLCWYVGVQFVVLVVIDGELIVYLEDFDGDGMLVFFDYLFYLCIIVYIVCGFDDMVWLGVQVMIFWLGSDFGLVWFIDQVV